MRRASFIVPACFIGLAVSVSPAYLSVFGLFIKPMADDLGMSRTELSSIPSMTALVSAILSPFVGALIDRWGSRSLAFIGAVLLPLGLLAHSLIGGSYSFILALSLFMGLASASACPLPYISILPQWFSRNLGLAISLGMAGIGFGQIVLPRVAAYLITMGGWRSAWGTMAAIVAVVGLLNAIFLLRDNPEFRARKDASRREGDAAAVTGATLTQAVRTPGFWLLAGSVFLVAQVGVGVMIHIVPLLTDRGITTVAASNAIAVMGVGSLIGRLSTGIALDRLNIAPVGGVLFSLQALGILALWSEMGGIVPYLAVFLIGVAVGAETDIIPFTIRAKFGLRQFGKIFGLAFGIFSLGPVVGPLVMGRFFDTFASYSFVLLLFSAASLLAAAFIMIVAAMDVKVEGSSEERRT